MKRIAAILALVLLASCGGRPGVTVSIAGATVPTITSSTTEGTPCSTVHSDGFAQNAPLTTVRAPTPVTLRFDAGQTATEIRGTIYDSDAPLPSGGPIEEFRLPGRTASHQPRSIVPGRTYFINVNIRWSLLATQGEESHVFRLRVEPP